jgi:hypothetical protein
MSELANTVSAVYQLVVSMASEERTRALRAVQVMCGDLDAAQTPAGQSDGGIAALLLPKVKRWLEQTGIDNGAIERCFTMENGGCELALPSMPGTTKREQTTNCYLLVGIRSFIATGEANFSETQVVDVCKIYGCHDAANHAVTRKNASSFFMVDRKNYVLNAKGMMECAKIINNIKNMQNITM